MPHEQPPATQLKLMPSRPLIDRRRWERPSAAPEVSEQEALACLAHWDDSAHDLHMTRLEDGLANGCWLLEWHGKTGFNHAVLRVSSRHHDDFTRESALLGWLDRGCQAPAILAHGMAPLRVPWVLLEYRDGQPLAQWLDQLQLEPSASLEALAHSIATHLLQRLALPALPDRLALPHYPGTQLTQQLQALLQHPQVVERLPEGLVRALAQRAEAWAPFWQDLQLEGLVHGDFGGSNLLIDDGGLTAVVDWEFAHQGSLLVDLGNLLRSPALRATAFTRALEQQMAAGCRPLPVHWFSMATLADSLNWLYFLSRPMHRPRLFADCEARLAEIVSLTHH